MQIIQMWIPGCSLIHNCSKYLHPLSSYFGLKYAKRMHRGCLSILQTLHFGQQKQNPAGVTAETVCCILTFLQRVKPLQLNLIFKNFTKPKCVAEPSLVIWFFKSLFPSMGITQDKLTEMDSPHFLGSVTKEGRTNPEKTQTLVV